MDVRPILPRKMAAPFAYDVFLSHNQADKPRVRRLAERLKAAGVRVWLDDWVIQAGDLIALKVDEGLEPVAGAAAVHLTGGAGLGLGGAGAEHPPNAGRRFIPLLLGDCALPDTLRRYKYVDFCEESEAAFEEARETNQRDHPKLIVAYNDKGKQHGI